MMHLAYIWIFLLSNSAGSVPAVDAYERHGDASYKEQIGQVYDGFVILHPDWTTNPYNDDIMGYDWSRPVRADERIECQSATGGVVLLNLLQ